MAEIKCAGCTFVDVWKHLRRRFTIERMRWHNASSSGAMWQNLTAPSSIEQKQPNVNDSHPSISSEPLVEDEEPNPTATPN